jgi:hypothetical protein
MRERLMMRFRAAAQLTNLGSGAKMVAALREALGADVHLPTSVLTGAKARLHATMRACVISSACTCTLADAAPALPPAGGHAQQPAGRRGRGGRGRLLL